MIVWVGVALLGGLGAVARDQLERGASLLLVNVLGAAILGALSGTSGDGRFLVATGFLGAFTSFSGWALRPKWEGVAALLLGLAACAAARSIAG